LYIPISGPQANQGTVGSTFQRTSKPTTDANSQPVQVENTEVFTYAQADIKAAPSYRTSGQLQDFRSKFAKKANKAAKEVGAEVQAPNYNTQNIENRVHLGDPGVKGDRSNYLKGKLLEGQTKSQAADKINALEIYTQSNVKTNSKSNPVNDLCKFRIAILKPGSANKTFIHFRAFLDTISDNFSENGTAFSMLGEEKAFTPTAALNVKSP